MGLVKKRYLLSAVFVLSATTSWAEVPPPPVNQIIGIPDSSFNNLVADDCRGCHEDTTIVNPGTIPDRHHLLVNTPLADPTVAPFAQPGDTTYQCLTCHQLEWNTSTSSYDFVPFRNCLDCHQQIAGEASVHHLSAKAQSRNCKACHGPIDNYNDGHYIPTYAPSLVTPWTSNKTNAGPNGEGQCTFCHAAGIDSASSVTVLSNMGTHHSTGIGFNNNAQCIWCHDLAAQGAQKIRRCEDCHGVASLHNIQADSNNDGVITSGSENAYYGHIGNNDDCFGCHGFTAMSAAAPYAGPVVPDVTSTSVTSVIEGTPAAVVVTGSSFTNTVTTNGQTIELTSNVVLTGQGGAQTTLVPSEISEGTLTITLPAELPAGNYDLQVVKAGKASNSLNISIIPVIDNYNIVCRGNSVTIKGKGYSEYVDALNSGTSLVALDRSRKEIDCLVNSWSDTKIIATCAACPDSVTVQSIWGVKSDRARKLRTTTRR